MAIIVLFICILVSTLYELSVRFNLESAGRSQRGKEVDMMEWARTHEDEWIFGTDHVYKRNGRLYYFGYGKDNLGYCDNILHVNKEVTYGWNHEKTHCGLVLNGQVVFGHNQFVNAKLSNGSRLQTINEKRALDLGQFAVGSWPLIEVYYIPEERKYYIKTAYGYEEVENKSYGANQYFQRKF